MVATQKLITKHVLPGHAYVLLFDIDIPLNIFNLRMIFSLHPAAQAQLAQNLSNAR